MIGELKYKENWIGVVAAIVQFNLVRKDAEVRVEDEKVIINGEGYKVDIWNFTGVEDRYIFFNPTAGYIYIQSPKGQRGYYIEMFDK